MLKINPDMRKVLIAVIFVLITLILTPIIIYTNISISFLENSSESFISKIKTIILLNIIFGFLIFIVVSIGYYFPEFEFKRTVFFIVGECIYCINLINISQLGNLDIVMDNFTFFFDISSIFLISIGIPILLIVRSLFSFKVKREKWVRYLVLIDLIDKNRNINTEIQLNQNIRSLNLESEILRDLLRNSDNYLNFLEKINSIERLRSYKLTVKGKNTLKKLMNIKYFNYTFPLINKTKYLEYWTEEELLNRKEK